MFPLAPDAAAPDAAAPDVAAEADVEDDFLPLEENNMELDQNPEEHIDRHQVSEPVCGNGLL